MKIKMMTRGKVARLAGVSVETVRFYENMGLLEKPARTSSGYRIYSPEAVKRIRFIKRAKELGFTLAEIKELLSLRATSGKDCDRVRQKAEEKIEEITERIKALQNMKRVLQKLVKECARKKPGSECAILDALEEG